MIDGPHTGKHGRLMHVEVTGFGRMICTLAVDEGTIRVRSSDLRA